VDAVVGKSPSELSSDVFTVAEYECEIALMTKEVDEKGEFLVDACLIIRLTQEFRSDCGVQLNSLGV
jgi:hypothetical protein